jgi:hypothetical protein
MSSDLKKYFSIALSIFVLSIMCSLSFTQPIQAEGPRGQGKPKASAVKRAPAHQQKHFIDSRFHHNRSYPARGQIVGAVPRDHRVFRHGHSRYYLSEGVWYRPHGGRFVIDAPPVGLFVPLLPFAYTTIWMHGIPYYYANDTYYTQTPGGYVVAEPPQGEVSESATDSEGEGSAGIADDKLFIYPRKGQSPEQQDLDRYECHKWAVEQTNYDPTKTPLDIPSNQMMQQRSDYQRAMTACLDGRGYTAK